MPRRSPAAVALVLTLAVVVGPSASLAQMAGSPAPAVAPGQAAVPQTAILDLTLTKGGAGELKPALRVPLGGQVSVEAAPGVTVSVTQALLNGKQLSLRLGVGETMPQGLMESAIAIDVPLDKPVKLQLGSDPARSWVVEFTPQVTPAPPRTSP